MKKHAFILLIPHTLCAIHLPSDKTIWKLTQTVPGVVQDIHKTSINVKTAIDSAGNALNQTGQALETVGKSLEQATENVANTMHTVKKIVDCAAPVAEHIPALANAIPAAAHEIAQSSTRHRVILDQENPLKMAPIVFDFNQAAWLRMGAAVFATGTFFTSLALIYYALTKEQTSRTKAVQSCTGLLGMILSIAWLDSLRNEINH